MAFSSSAFGSATFVDFCVLLLIIQCSATGSSSPCLTPDRLGGTCKPITECSSLNYLQVYVNKTVDQKEFLRNSTCGFLNRIPRVCCPGHPDTLRTDLLPDTCGTPVSVDRIIRGPEPALDEYPWLALIEYVNKASGQIEVICGSTIISSRYVLTLATCLNLDPTRWSSPKNIRVGEHDLRTDLDCKDDYGGGLLCNEPLVVIPVEELIYHKAYGKSFIARNDIGLIRTAEEIKWNDFVQPLCLPTSGLRKFIEESDDVLKAATAGWGRTVKEAYSDILQDVNFDIFKGRECVSDSALVINADYNDLCGGNAGDNIDVCKRADFGGPVVLCNRDYMAKCSVIGVMSYPEDCGKPNQKVYFVNVQYHLDWILSNLKP